MNRLPATNSALRDFVMSPSPAEHGKFTRGSGGKGLAPHDKGTLPTSNSRDRSAAAYTFLAARARVQFSKCFSQDPESNLIRGSSQQSRRRLARSPTPPCKQRTSRSPWPVKNSNLTPTHTGWGEKRGSGQKTISRHIYCPPPTGIDIPVFQSSFHGT